MVLVINKFCNVMFIHWSNIRTSQNHKGDYLCKPIWVCLFSSRICISSSHSILIHFSSTRIWNLQWCGFKKILFVYQLVLWKRFSDWHLRSGKRYSHAVMHKEQVTVSWVTQDRQHFLVHWWHHWRLFDLIFCPPAWWTW